MKHEANKTARSNSPRVCVDNLAPRDNTYTQAPVENPAVVNNQPRPSVQELPDKNECACTKEDNAHPTDPFVWASQQEKDPTGDKGQAGYQEWHDLPIRTLENKLFNDGHGVKSPNN